MRLTYFFAFHVRFRALRYVSGAGVQAILPEHPNSSRSEYVQIGKVDIEPRHAL